MLLCHYFGAETHRCMSLRLLFAVCELIHIHVREETATVDCVWNVMAHAQKPDFVFRRNGRVHLNRRGGSVQSTTGSRGVRISGSNDGYTMFRGSMKSTGYPLHSPVFPSLPHPCVTVCHDISTGLYRVPEGAKDNYVTGWIDEIIH